MCDTAGPCLEYTDGFELCKGRGGLCNEGGGHLQWVMGQKLLGGWCGGAKHLPGLRSKLGAFRKGLVPALSPFSFHMKHGAGPWL